MIKTENLTYTYSPGTPFQKVAIENINIEIAAGEFVGIIGHTGSGKSTLIQHFNGLIKPTAGKVYIDGADIWAENTKMRDVRFKVGLVFQYPEYQLFEETVYKDIAFGPKNMGHTPEEIDRLVKDAMDFVGLSHKNLEKSPFELSGGQQRRVAIAGVIAMNPSVLILDEPTAGLDPKGRDMILEQIGSYQKQTGKTVLLVSHSMEDIAKYAAKVLVMNRSELFMYDTTQNVFAQADRLRAMGLEVPQITRIFTRLAGSGFPVGKDILTLEQGKKALLGLLAKGGSPC